MHIKFNYISVSLLYLQNTLKQLNRLQIKTSINIAGNVAICFVNEHNVVGYTRVSVWISRGIHYWQVLAITRVAGE